MNAEEPLEPDARQGSTMRTALVVGLIAFVAGLAAMAAVMWVYSPAPADREAGQPAIPTVATPSPQALPPLAPGTDLASLSAREEALAARIAELEARLRVIDADARTAAGYATRSEALVVALAARRALDRGMGLGYLQAQLRERFGASEPAAVETIVQASEDPVTREDLRVALDAMAPMLVSGAPNLGWWQSFKRELASLVVVRDEKTPSPRPHDRMTRARRMLDAGNVEAALGEVSRMPGAPGAQKWADAAKRYIRARAALDTIEVAALQGRGGPAAQTQNQR